jgi:hypothetical protein
MFQVETVRRMVLRDAILRPALRKRASWRGALEPRYCT